MSLQTGQCQCIYSVSATMQRKPIIKLGEKVPFAIKTILFTSMCWIRFTTSQSLIRRRVQASAEQQKHRQVPSAPGGDVQPSDEE